MHQVGAGVLGPVFRGYDPEEDRAVAIKAFALDLTPEQARALAADLGRLPNLSLRHPSIVTPYAAGWEGATAYLVEEYFVAESADVALKQYGPAPVPDGMRLIGQLAGALDFAAAAGVHHGALHPRDILVAPHEVRLSGLGVVEALERVGYRPPARRPYSAPERAAGAPFGSAADVFSLACVAFELLTGRRPAVLSDNVSAECDAIPAADRAALTEVFARALSAQPEDRHGSALAFAAALKHALTGEPLLAGEHVERPRTRRAPRSPKKEAGSVSQARGSEHHAEAAADDRLPLTGPGEPLPSGALPSDEPPGSTPLPAFLETYRPPMEADLAQPPATPSEPSPSLATLDDFASRTDALPPGDAVDSFDQVSAEHLEEPASPHPLQPVVVPIRADEGAPSQPARADFDLHALEDGIPSIVSAPPEPAIPGEASREPVRPLDDSGRRLGKTEEIPVTQPSLRLDEPEAVTAPPSVSEAAAEPPAGRTPSEHKPSRIGLASLVGMLLIGFLLGIPAGYMMAPKPAPSAAADVQKPVPQPQSTGAPASAAEPVKNPAPLAPVAQGPAEAAPATPRPTSAAPPAAGKSAAASAAPRQATPKPAARGSRQQAARTGAAQRSGAATASKPAPSARATFEGSLVIASKPDGASISIDGRPVGTTPLTMKALTAGSHAVRLELAGYYVWTSSVQVTAGRVNRVTASLERRPGG